MSAVSTCWGWFLGIAFAFSGNCALAQITPDGTLPNNSNVRLQGNTFNITGGTQAGSNLFHSFGQFSVPTGGTAFFNNAVDIQNIISRVTGGSISNIDGSIRANGTANLFLINPSGIVFGQNASLNVGGSFVASTASSLKFADGFEFGATAPQTTPLLTISVPTGLQFGANPGSIQNQSVATNSNGESVGLQVEPGKTLALVGGEVRLDGSLLQAANGRVELAGVAGSGTVNLQVNNNNLSLSFPVDIPRADVSLLNAKVDVTNNGAGSVGITARSIDILGGSKISAGLSKEAGIASVPGNITLNATGVVTIDQLSRITNTSAEGTTGNAGNISIQAGDIFINNRASVPNQDEILPAALDTSSRGQGRAGNVLLSGTGLITLIGQDATDQDLVISTNGNIKGAGDISVFTAGSILLSDAYLFAGSEKANGGNISLLGNNISIADNSSLISGTNGGIAGNIRVKSAGNVSIQKSLFVSAVGGESASQGGDINITGQSVFVTDGSELTARSYNGAGNSGNININAKDTVEISGREPISFLESRADRSATYFYTILTTLSDDTAKGTAGNININTDKLRVFDGATIAADTKSDFRGGDIMVNAKVVELFGGGQILTTARSRGNAGNIFLQVDDGIVLSGTNPNYAEEPLRFGRTVEGVSPSSGLFANTETGSLGNGGSIQINSANLSINNGAGIGINSNGFGSAGELLTINARDAIALDNGVISSQLGRQAEGRGGGINLQTRSLFLTNNAQVTASTFGKGDAGNITLTADIAQATKGGQFRSSTASGNNAGNITFRVRDQINLTGEDSGLFVNSQSPTGAAGDIIVTSPRVTLDNGGRLNAESASGNGGNINLKSNLLLLRRNSQISTTAGTAEKGGNGGNINIDAGFIVAVPQENSDITANAFSGNGGTVTINAQGIFGIQRRQQLTSQSDITASSTGGGINGVVNINTLDIDPNRGLLKLPTGLVNVPALVASNCGAFGKGGSEFTVTGRGGLPLSPDDFLSPDVVWTDNRLSNTTQQQHRAEKPTTKPAKPKTLEIIPATGWVINDKGEVTLISSAPSASSSVSPPTCVQQ